MGTKIDLTGQKIGHWKVLRQATKAETAGRDGIYWLCECDCESKTRKFVAGKSLKNRTSLSCGHDTNGFKDLKDKQFGEWKVLRQASKEDIEKYSDILVADTKAYWLCRCSCDKLRVVRGSDLRNEKTKSCGHSTSAFKDLSGEHFGKWEVLRRATKEDIENSTLLQIPEETYWVCKCECDKIKLVSRNNLLQNKSTSCGCDRQYDRPLNSERTAEQIELMENTDKFKQALIEFEKNRGRKPNTRDVMKMIGVKDMTCALEAVKRRGFTDLVHVHKTGSSIYEIEIAEALGLPRDKYIMNDRKTLGGHEIDILIPEHNLGIEFNGNYWHSEVFKDKLYHQQKTIAAKNKGINIVHIFEYELWDEDKAELILNVLKGKVNSNNKKVVYARECKVIPMNNVDAALINEKYHLQGHVNASITFGLEHEGEVVSLMSFGRPRFSGEAEWELLRYTTRYDIGVVGGAERLLSYFRKLYSGSIITYCDISKFTGDVYSKLGFRFMQYTAPNYVWYNEEIGDTLSRYKTQKHKLIEKGLGTEEQTENEIMEAAGYIKVYDCGNAKYILE